MHVEQFKETLRKLCTELEDLWIEKEAYRHFILMMRTATSDYLDEMKKNSLTDPQIRAETHERFSEMWKALEEGGMEAFYEDLLKDLPPNDKPN